MAQTDYFGRPTSTPSFQPLQWQGSTQPLQWQSTAQPYAATQQNGVSSMLNWGTKLADPTRDTAVGMAWNSNALVNSFIEEYGLPGQTGTLNTPAAVDGGWLSKDSMLGNSKTGEAGWLGPAANIGFGAFNTWMGGKKLDLAQKEFDETTRQYNQDYAAQGRLTNGRLEQQQLSRQRAGRSTESVDSYLNRAGVQVV